MTPSALLTLTTVGLAILVATPLLGGYMATALQGERTFLSPLLGPVERAVLRGTGVRADVQQTWSQYAISFIAFSIASIAALFLWQEVQQLLPLNPAGFGPVEPTLALNTAVSFATTTNWQNYAGESTLSHLTQTAGIAVGQFVAAAAGIAVGIAVIRGFMVARGTTLGNFWVDVVRSTTYVLLPIAAIVAVVDVWQGVPQTVAGAVQAVTLQGGTQSIALGLIASQDPIKILGSNGGGYLNANGAHPLINPTAITNWLGLFVNLVIPFAFTATFGRLVGDRRQGWTLFAAMAVVLVIGSLGVTALESSSNPLLPGGVDQVAGNMEGKETRFGAALGGLDAATMAATTTGAPAATYSSLQPLSGGIAIGLMALGPVTPGGDGSGIVGMLLFVLLSLFLAGLMVGRTPEYLGKRIEAREMKLVLLVLIAFVASVLVLPALAVSTAEGRAGPGNSGPHAFSEIVYAFTSMTATNGSAMASLTGNTAFYNLTGIVAMLIGRFAPAVGFLALAGSMAAKRRRAPSLGTFPTDGPLFVGLLVGVVIIVGALEYLPALSLGPIVEQLLQAAGHSF